MPCIIPTHRAGREQLELARTTSSAGSSSTVYGATNTNSLDADRARRRPGPKRALRSTFLLTKLDRLVRSLPDAREILAELTAKNVRLIMGGSVHDPADPVRRLLFNVLAMVAEFESDLIRARTREGMQVAKAKGRLRGKQPKLTVNQAKHPLELSDLGTYSTAELAELFGVGRSTTYRTPTRVRPLPPTRPGPSPPDRPDVGGRGWHTRPPPPSETAGCGRASGIARSYCDGRR